MVPVQRLGLEAESQNKREYDERYALLDDLELDQVEGAAVDIGPQSVGGNHKAVLKQSQTPGCQYNKDKRPVCTDLHLLKLKVSVPRKSHKDIGYNQKQYCPYSPHL